MGGSRDCVVSLIDLVGIKRLAQWGQKGEASKRMRRLHQRVCAQMRRGLKHHTHAYVWNDSVLLLAFLDRTNTPEAVLRDVDGLKRTLEQFGESYAVSVQGQTFPDLRSRKADNRQTRATVIEASSYALGNCFRIEEIAKKRNLKKPWYVDSRLAKKIRTEQGCSKMYRVELLPRLKQRKVYVYDGYLWDCP